MRCHNSFLVKVWTEDGENLIRGYIQHVGTEQDIYFLGWERMFDFIKANIDWDFNQGMYEDELDSFYPRN